MKKILLERYIVKNISFNNNLEDGQEITLEVNYGFESKHAKHDERLIKGTLIADIGDQNSQKKLLNIHLEIDYFFVFEEKQEKEAARNMMIHEAFPYLKSCVTYLVVLAGLPPLYVPALDPEDFEESKGL